MFPYSWFSSAVDFSFLPVHLLGVVYVFVAFNFRPSHNPNRSYLKDWYHFNCLFQCVLALLLVPDILVSLFSGWHYSVCQAGTLYTGGLSGSVVFLWTLTKISDLVETMLLLHDGRRPLSIHIVHHFLSLSYAFTFYSLSFAIHRWIVFFNLTAHVILYAYLSGLKILQAWTPCWVAVCSSQMLQLILPFVASLSVAAKMSRGKQCDANALGIFALQIGLAVMIIIFADFYWSRLQAFRRKNMKKQKEEVGERSPEADGKKSKTQTIRKLPSDETAVFENDFPELRSVIFSP